MNTIDLTQDQIDVLIEALGLLKGKVTAGSPRAFLIVNLYDQLSEIAAEQNQSWRKTV